MSANGSRLVALDPTSGPPPAEERRSLARRPERLDGAVVGLVINGLGRAEAFLGALYEEVAAKVPVLAALPVVKGSVSVPPDPGDWSRLTAEASVAITGFGG
jgi:hypothetical protein